MRFGIRALRGKADGSENGESPRVLYIKNILTFFFCFRQFSYNILESTLLFNSLQVRELKRRQMGDFLRAENII